MSGQHVVEATEPYWVTHRYSRGKTGITLVDTNSVGDAIDRLMEHAEYTCSCGKTFETWPEAAEHLERPEFSESAQEGEA